MLDANTPDLISILGDAPSMENLRALARSRRDYAERMVETLIDALDALDGDPDLEPWLGSPNIVPERRRDPRHRFGKGTRRIPMTDHLAFAYGLGDDREEEDERGGEITDEPHDDDERDGQDDNGIADMDGMCEQVQAYDGRLLWSKGGYVA